MGLNGLAKKPILGKPSSLFSPDEVLTAVEKDMPKHFTLSSAVAPSAGMHQTRRSGAQAYPAQQAAGQAPGRPSLDIHGAKHSPSARAHDASTQHFRRAQDLTRMCARRREGGAKGAYGLSEDFCWLFWVNPKKKEFTAAGGTSVNDCFWTSFT